MKSTLIAAAAFGFAAAAPTAKRTTTINDGDILNYALTLEHLENTFYREALEKFSEQDFLDAGYDAFFYKNIKEVAYDEATHVSFLTTALQGAGVTPVKECTYSFGVTDVDSFLATAAVLEGVGVSAYLGAAASIVEKAYLTAAGSILTVEARHVSYIRGEQEQFPYPQAFDAPLSFNEVYTLAAPFFVSCPSDNPPLPVKAFPGLAVQADGPIRTGDEITLATAGYDLVQPEGQNVPLYAAWIAVTGPTFTPVKAAGDGKTFTTTVPEGFHGQSYLVLTACNDKPVSDDTTTAGPAIVEIAGANGQPDA